MGAASLAWASVLSPEPPPGTSFALRRDALSKTVYGSDPLYDLEAALANAKTAEPKYGLSVEQLYWRTHWPEAPSEEGLRKHRRRYGGESIAEIAGSYDLKAAAKEARRLERSEAKRSRRTTAELRAEIMELHERGLIPAAIADVLNLSDRRVKALLAQAA